MNLYSTPLDQIDDVIHNRRRDVSKSNGTSSANKGSMLGNI